MQKDTDYDADWEIEQNIKLMSMTPEQLDKELSDDIVQEEN
jgi:hypothetical protein